MQDIDALVDCYQTIAENNERSAEKYRGMHLPKMVDWCEGQASAYNLVVCDLLRRFYDGGEGCTTEGNTETQANP
jgi:hypothetical protein